MGLQAGAGWAEAAAGAKWNREQAGQPWGQLCDRGDDRATAAPPYIRLENLEIRELSSPHLKSLTGVYTLPCKDPNSTNARKLTQSARLRTNCTSAPRRAPRRDGKPRPL